MLVSELEGLDETEGLVHGPSDGEVVDRDLAEDPGRRDDEEAAEGDAGVVALVCGLFGEGGEKDVSFFSFFFRSSFLQKQPLACARAFRRKSPAPRPNVPSRLSRSPMSTPKSLEIDLVMSATRGYPHPPSPPLSRGVSIQARCEKWESTETPTTSAPMALNSETRSEKAMISVLCF